MRKGCSHASADRLVGLTGQQRIEPEKMATALMNEAHGLGKFLRATPVPPITDDDYQRTLRRSRPQIFRIETKERTADVGPARPVNGPGLNPPPGLGEWGAPQIMRDPG